MEGLRHIEPQPQQSLQQLIEERLRTGITLDPELAAEAIQEDTPDRSTVQTTKKAFRDLPAYLRMRPELLDDLMLQAASYPRELALLVLPEVGLLLSLHHDAGECTITVALPIFGCAQQALYDMDQRLSDEYTTYSLSYERLGQFFDLGDEHNGILNYTKEDFSPEEYLGAVVTLIGQEPFMISFDPHANRI